MLVIDKSEIMEVKAWERECVRILTQMQSVSFFASMSHIDGSGLTSMNLDLKMWSECRGYAILAPFQTRPSIQSEVRPTVRTKPISIRFSVQLMSQICKPVRTVLASIYDPLDLQNDQNTEGISVTTTSHGH
jgi:hypothetical protein